MCEALQQNECYDIFKDDFASLADDDAGPAPGRRRWWRRTRSRLWRTVMGKKVTCGTGTTRMKGVAVSCAEQQSFERVATGGQARHGAVLVWHFADPIYPQMVLEAPVDVHSFHVQPGELGAGGGRFGQRAGMLLGCLRAARGAGEEENHGADGDGPVTVPTCQPTYLSEFPTRTCFR